MLSLSVNREAGKITMSKTTVYLFTQDQFLAQHLERINNDQFVTKHIETLLELVQLPTEQLLIVDIARIQWGNAQWQQVFAQQNVVVASFKPNDPEGQQAFLHGAKAYTQAYTAPAQWRMILQQVAAGQVWLGQSLMSRLLSQASRGLADEVSTEWQKDLTAREIDVAQRAALGHSNAMIAEDLAISERTVRAHLGSVFSKLGISDRLMLVLKVHGLQ